MSHRVVVKRHEKIFYNQFSFYNINHNFYNEDKYMEKHWHNSIEISYVVKGLKIQHVEDKEVIAPEGTLLLMNSGVIHDVKVNKGLEGIVLLIDRYYVEKLYPDLFDNGMSFCLEKDLEGKQKIIEYMFQLVKANESKNIVRCHILVLEIIDILVNKMLDEQEYIKRNEDVHHNLVIIISEFIDYNYMKKISLDELARITNYNRTYLATIFKKITGKTIFQYLNDVRMQHCINDLKFTNNSIVNIALNNGFANIQIFNKKFKQIYNVTPKEFRKRYQKQNKNEEFDE